MLHMFGLQEALRPLVPFWAKSEWRLYRGVGRSTIPVTTILACLNRQMHESV